MKQISRLLFFCIFFASCANPVTPMPIVTETSALMELAESTPTPANFPTTKSPTATVTNVAKATVESSQLPNPLPKRVSSEALQHLDWATDFPLVSKDEYARLFEELVKTSERIRFDNTTEPVEILSPQSSANVTAVDVRLTKGVNFFPQYIFAVETEHGVANVLMALVVARQSDGSNAIVPIIFGFDPEDISNTEILRQIGTYTKMQIVIVTRNKFAENGQKNPIFLELTGSDPARRALEQGILDENTRFAMLTITHVGSR